MEERRKYFSVVIFRLFLFTYGQFVQHSEAADSRFLPVVINTWGPPFTNATAEGKPEMIFEVVPLKKNLKGSFGLHAKMRLLGSTFHLFYMQKNCRPFELLVDKYEDPALLFVTTRPQGSLRFQDGDNRNNVVSSSAKFNFKLDKAGS